VTAWTEEEDATLRELWPNTLSSDIADKLGRTRNSVIGRADRLGLKRFGHRDRCQRASIGVQRALAAGVQFGPRPRNGGRIDPWRAA